MPEAEPEDDAREVVVLDYLPHGRSDDDRPQYQQDPLAHGLNPSFFGLLELILTQDGSLTIGSTVRIEPPEESIETVRAIEYSDLSGGAQSELEHVVADLVEANENRFVEFFNEAGPITLRLHQLNLLSGIGDKLRDTMLDERERNEFTDLEDLDERVDGLHDPNGILVDRIMAEIKDEDVKYKLFAGEQ
jgi:putative nucleotide binding protein